MKQNFQHGKLSVSEAIATVVAVQLSSTVFPGARYRCISCWHSRPRRVAQYGEARRLYLCSNFYSSIRVAWPGGCHELTKFAAITSVVTA